MAITLQRLKKIALETKEKRKDKSLGNTVRELEDVIDSILITRVKEDHSLDVKEGFAIPFDQIEVTFSKLQDRDYVGAVITALRERYCGWELDYDSHHQGNFLRIYPKK